MFDITQLTSEELSDQCRALVQSIIEVNSAEIKEILTFILAERFEHLRASLNAAVNE